jgi:DNA-binding CsgD family transcriptional regulator
MPDCASPGQPSEFADSESCPFFISPLSSRQLDCLRLAALGQTDQAIARQLTRKDGRPISPRTVQAHLHDACEALGANGRTHAVFIAQGLGLIKFDTFTAN